MASKKTQPLRLPHIKCMGLIMVATSLCLTFHFLNCFPAIQKHSAVSKFVISKRV